MIQQAAPPTTIHNDIPVLMVANAGDPITPYFGRLVLHRVSTVSCRRLTPAARRSAT
ncbi:alpha/beta hydrolase [Nonomuraea aurantiaca]|uniref:alpha/beta hydrolase n=1 Tax=Nonomuraea aurantiaca TaxID=2878562 RepID=UPI001CDA39B0|nr:alpha/beta hydrolase [Nonomuraea aurantiaca]MCA2221722.1 alpha/beta hydrolase [Nonomuraea aurantiaca]